MWFYAEGSRFWKRMWCRLSFVGSLWLGVLLGGPGFAEPVISEFLAQSERGLSDDDGDRSDWIEIHNPDARSWNLAGWALTDDPTLPAKWVFPEVNLGAGGYLVVFASGKDRRELGAPLHTNFRLRAGGEYLGLLNPMGEAAFEFTPEYPVQTADVSFGRGQTPAVETVLLASRAPARALIPSDGNLGTRWTELDFDDSAWRTGRTGVGYDYGDLVGLNVADMRGGNPSVYVRVPFTISDLSAVGRLLLRFRYEDGFVAYLNGERIAADNAPSNPSWNATASADRPDAQATTAVDIDISAARVHLRGGANVLAIHGLNRASTSSDILILPELVTSEAGELQNAGYQFAPSPGELNRDAVTGVLEPPSLSMGSQTFGASLTVEIQAPESMPEGAGIFYTRDGSIPGSGSTPYTGPITLRETTQIRCRVVGTGGETSRVVGETYVQLHAEVRNFSSDLPLIVLENFRQGRPPQSGFQSGFMAVIEPGETGRTQLLGQPELSVRAGLKVRGSSTAGRPKPSLSVEAWDQSDNGLGINPLGLPRDSDWVLWGPYNFDLSLMHNPFIYELSNQIGRYAPRTRFVEVFLNTNGGPLRSDDYYGVYALIEKIKRDDDRVDVARVFPEHDRLPNVSGGYVLKIDRADPGDSGFSGAGQRLRYVYPKEEEIERPERAAQRQFLTRFFQDFGRAVNGSNFRDPEQGYARYVDVDAAIDHHLLNVLAFNVDALRLSGYMSIPRNGKLVFGPIWDFDRALGSTDGRDFSPSTWRARGGDRGTDFFNYPWWNRMFRDIDFFQRYIDRFQSLRQGAFSQANMNAVIDGMADSLREAQDRNEDRWGQRPRSQFGRTYQGEINHMKDWLSRRSQFMESQFVDPPRFVSTVVGSRVELASREGGEIYYTLDGSDPRITGGNVAQGAVRYTEPFSITESVEVIARVRDLEHTSLTGANNPPLSSKWSGPVSRVYVVDPAPSVGDLVVSEIHYNPVPPSLDELALDGTLRSSDFEFVELQNRSGRRLDLTGVRLAGAVAFEFGEETLNRLLPGESLVLVANADAFRLRYGAALVPFGRFAGSLDDDAEVLTVFDGQGGILQQIGYRDDWYPGTDGFGFSLVATELPVMGDPVVGPGNYRPSVDPGGSPGESDGDRAPLPRVVISEVLNNSDLPMVDAVELTNEGDEAVDLSGWLLTDSLRDPQKYAFPTGSVIAPGSRLVIDENSFGATEAGAAGFGLSSQGEQVYLFGVQESGQLSGYVTGFEFGALPAGWSQGPWRLSDGRHDIVPFGQATLGLENSEPSVGPVVISEIFASPRREGENGETQDDEFIELTNLSQTTVHLGGEVMGGITWRIRGGVGFEFSEGTALAPGQQLLLVPFDPAEDGARLEAFRVRWSLPPSAMIQGPLRGRLDNGGDVIRLQRTDPSLVDAEGGETYFSVERIAFSDEAPWPVPSSEGGSLQRQPLAGYGNEPLHWVYGEPQPLAGDGPVLISIESITVADGGVELSILAPAGQTLVLQSLDQLGAGTWETLEMASVPADHSGTFVMSDPSPDERQRFYRVQLAGDGDL